MFCVSSAICLLGEVHKDMFSLYLDTVAVMGAFDGLCSCLEDTISMCYTRQSP